MLERIETRAGLRGGGRSQGCVAITLTEGSAVGDMVQIVQTIEPMYTGWSVRSLNAISMGAQLGCLSLRPLVHVKTDQARVCWSTKRKGYTEGPKTKYMYPLEVFGLHGFLLPLSAIARNFCPYTLNLLTGL